MNKMIACCGIDCNECDARNATVNNDDQLRKSTAEKWQKAFNAAGITAEMINCTGCMEEGVKFAHCLDCEIRKCVIAKGYMRCNECPSLKECEIVSFIFKSVPGTLQNLLELNN